VSRAEILLNAGDVHRRHESSSLLSILL